MASQITATLPTLDFPKEVDYPTQEDWAAFSAAAELNYGILGGSWSTQMQLWKTEANAMSNELNTNATIAQGLANYQGDWTSKGYTLNQTVSVGGIYYICKLTHETVQSPTTIGSLYWNLALGNWSLKADKTEVALKIDKDISLYTSKTTPVDADLIPLSDSASSFGIKKLSWANLKIALATLFALKDSPAFTGTPTAPTQTAQDNSTKLATTAYVDGTMVRATAVNATSGTSIDFTGIPSWAKRITVMLSGVSTNGSSNPILRVGTSAGVVLTGYKSDTVSVTGSGVSGSNTNYGVSLPSVGHTAAYQYTGLILLIHLGGNIWVITGTLNIYTVSVISMSSNISLASALDRIRLTTMNGTDTFDAGSINIMYEG